VSDAHFRFHQRFQAEQCRVRMFQWMRLVVPGAVVLL
jgi:hypothetical protein